jgi:hypothetical protein
LLAIAIEITHRHGFRIITGAELVRALKLPVPSPNKIDTLSEPRLATEVLLAIAIEIAHCD